MRRGHQLSQWILGPNQQTKRKNKQLVFTVHRCPPLEKAFLALLNDFKLVPGLQENICSTITFPRSPNLRYLVTLSSTTLRTDRVPPLSVVCSGWADTIQIFRARPVVIDTVSGTTKASLSPTAVGRYRHYLPMIDH